MLRYNTIQHGPRKKLGLTATEYMICDIYYHLSCNPKNQDGWAFISRKRLADELGFSKRHIIRLINKLIDRGLLMSCENGFKVKTTIYWYENVIESQKQPETSGDICSPSVTFGHRLGGDISSPRSYNNKLTIREFSKKIDFKKLYSDFKDKKPLQTFYKFYNKNKELIFSLKNWNLILDNFFKTEMISKSIDYHKPLEVSGDKKLDYLIFLALKGVQFDEYAYKLYCLTN